MATDLKDVKKAIREHRGNVTNASATLGISRVALSYRISHNPKLKEIVKTERENKREEKVDKAESNVEVMLDAKDWRATRYILSTLGRNRGYVERQEVEEIADSKKQVFIIGEQIIEF